MLVVPRTPTRVAQAAFPGLIDRAFTAEGRPLRGIQRMMLAVLACIETARGKSVQNFNVGNLTAGAQYEGAIWRPPWFDPAEAAGNPRLEALHVEMLKGNAPSAFRAYDSPEEGARDFARVLMRSFPEVMNAALVPNANAFREALSKKYSRDYARTPDATNKSIAQLMKEYGITSTAGGAAGSLVLVALVVLAWRYFKRS